MRSDTKVIATIGPASDTKEVIEGMISHHMDMARLNFSWGNYEWFTNIIKIIREEATKQNTEVPIIQDLSGPRVQDGAEHRFGGEEGQEVITEKDIADLHFGIEQGVDYVALSFVGRASDVIKLKELIKEKNGNQKVIAKIERKLAFDNLNEIIKEADGVMVARGDLGNEFPLEEIPFVQHEIIEACNKAGKMVIVATQMLLSMVENETPTRAEVSDVAYAILDGADGVMLSEESAKGKYPMKAIGMMEKIALVAEKHRDTIKIG
ncbi:MAG TPA: pyruvate kinase [Candidatus Paceibacterota bacterium]|nr:pyruvate kinase [Candidatus Paceibacterota bacterium]